MFSTSKIRSCFVLLLFFLQACTSLPPEQRDTAREELALATQDIVRRAIERNPELEAEIAAAPGYFASRISGASLMVGGAVGTGELHDRRDGSVTYIDIRQLDVGAAVSISRGSFLAVFHDEEPMDKFLDGDFFPALSAASNLGESGGRRSSSASKEGVSTFYLPEGGASVVLTTRLIKAKVNEDLTDTGLSSIGLPNTGFDTAGEQSENAPRRWDRALPLMAQQVVDLGYDLPLPFGVRLNYAGIDQDMFLGELDVGFNGGSKDSFDFVSFSDASANSDSVQLILDAWLFPFMNLSFLVGELDGEAPMDIFLDGNGMLDQLGEDCDGPGLNPLCRLLGDNTFLLPIEAKFSGTTYGVGLMLAGGWEDYFVTIPFNFTYADMDTTKTDGIAYTVTPRVGRSFQLGQAGTVSAFIGGNYLIAELDVTGSVAVPGVDLTIDYEVQQKNADRWNAVVGANWDISKRWAWAMEYNGFTGSRDAFITSVNYRF
ncbi:MAG: hypothetical protein ABJN62_13555 [Halioglobus sp.]